MCGCVTQCLFTGSRLLRLTFLFCELWEREEISSGKEFSLSWNWMDDTSGTGRDPGP